MKATYFKAPTASPARQVYMFVMLSCAANLYPLFATHGLPRLTCWNNFRIRLLVGCHGLEEDTSRFAQRRPPIITPYAPTCKLCGLEPENPAHFIVCCPALARTRNFMLQSSSYLPCFFPIPINFWALCSVPSGSTTNHCSYLLLNSSIVFAWCTIPYCFLPTDLGYSPLVEVTKSKKKKTMIRSAPP